MAQVERRSGTGREHEFARSWSVDGIDPSVRERAEAAARRAGMSLSDWLNSTVGEPAPPSFSAPPSQRPAMPSRESRDVADIHQRLDSITKQIEQISRPAPRGETLCGEASRGEPTVARQLNDAISRLDARLSQISNPAPTRQAQMQEKQQRQTDMVERAAAQVYRPAPPLSPASLDFAIAEIAARQNGLDSPPPRQMPPRHAAPTASPAQPNFAQPNSSQPMMQAAPAGPDFSSLERHLLKIASQIEALQRPDHVEESIAAFRSELAEIRQAITEAVPRREIESLENEIRSLSRRIDDNRQNGSDGQMLAGIERALGEIREALRSMTPAEQLTGYDEAIRNLGAKLDLILRSNDDPSTVQQLEGAIAALRGIVSNVASNDALARLADDVHTLSAKVDQLSRFDGNSDAIGMIEQRLAALTSTLETRQPPAASDNSEYLKTRCARCRSGSTHPGRQRQCLGVCPSRKARVLSAGTPGSLRRSFRRARHRPRTGRGGAAQSWFARTPARQPGRARRLQPQFRRHGLSRWIPASSIWSNASCPTSASASRKPTAAPRTRSRPFTARSASGIACDDEGDLRTVRTAPPARRQPSPPPIEVLEEAPRLMTPLQTWPQQSKPELPNPAALQTNPQEHFAAAPREFHAAQPAAPTAPPLPPRAISEILEPHAAAPRTAIAPELPPDHPLEPGTRPPRACPRRQNGSRLPKTPSAKSLPGRRSRSVRRASLPPAPRGEAAAAAPPPAKRAGRSAAKAKTKDKGGDKAKAEDKNPSNITSKIRSLLVGASVVVIVLGTFKMAMTLLDTGSELQLPTMGHSSEPAAPAQAPAPAENPPSLQCPRRAGALDDIADTGREAVEQFFRTEHAG